MVEKFIFGGCKFVYWEVAPRVIPFGNCVNIVENNKTTVVIVCLNWPDYWKLNKKNNCALIINEPTW